MGKWGTLLDKVQRTVCCASSLPKNDKLVGGRPQGSDTVPFIGATPIDATEVVTDDDSVFGSIKDYYEPPLNARHDENRRRFEREVHKRKLSLKMSQSGGFRGPKKSTSEACLNMMNGKDDYVHLHNVIEHSPVDLPPFNQPLADNRFVSMPAMYAPKVPDRREKPRIVVNNNTTSPQSPPRPPVDQKPLVRSATPSPRTPTAKVEDLVYVPVIGKSAEKRGDGKPIDTTYTPIDSQCTQDLRNM